MKYFFIFVVFVILVLVVIMNKLKQKYYFYPNKKLEWYPINYNYDDQYIVIGNKIINYWFIKYATEYAKYPTVLICHGNAGNISNRKMLIELFNKIKCNVCLFDYSGYGKSTGTPSEKNFYHNAELVYFDIVEKYGLESIILVGESIGSAVASYLANKIESEKLIIISGFTSIKDVLDCIMDNPIVHLISNFCSEFRTNNYLKEYNGKVLLLHSKEDELIPYSHAIKNGKNCQSDLVQITGGHNYPNFDKDTIASLTKFIYFN